MNEWAEITLMVVMTLYLILHYFISYKLLQYCNDLRNENIKLKKEAYVRRLRAKKDPDE
jgi:hypothetical protein